MATETGSQTHLPRGELSAGKLAARRGSRRRLLLPILCSALVLVLLGPPLVSYAGSALAVRALDAGQSQRAATILRPVLALQPGSAALHDLYGYVLYTQGDIAAAAVHLRRASELDPGLASARHNLGTLLLAQGDPAAAVVHLDAAAALDPGNAAAFHSLGDAALLAGDRRKAQAAYARAWQLDPSLLEVRSRWAALLVDEARWAEARHAWEAILIEQPGNPAAQFGLGVVSLAEGRPAAALAHLEIARLADPADARVRLYLGMAHQALGEVTLAEEEFQAALLFSREPALVTLARRSLNELHASAAVDTAPQPAVEAADKPGRSLFR